MLESVFRDNFLKELKGLFPGCLILKGNSSYKQGVPDILMLWEHHWAMFELKRSPKAVRQPNQEWYVEKLNDMSFAAFVHPANKNEVLDDLQRSFKSQRLSRRA